MLTLFIPSTDTITTCLPHVRATWYYVLLLLIGFGVENFSLYYSLDSTVPVFPLDLLEMSRPQRLRLLLLVLASHD